jgi:hypothetical protein
VYVHGHGRALRLDPVEIMRSNMDSLSTIITFGSLIGKAHVFLN